MGRVDNPPFFIATLAQVFMITLFISRAIFARVSFIISSYFFLTV